MLRRGVHRDFDEFVAARAAGLLGTAYLLSGQADRAEDLLEQALARVWSTWGRSELGPDLTARRELVRASRRHMHRGREAAGEPGLGEQLRALPHRQRAALVLRHLDGLDPEDVAHVLDCTDDSVAHWVESACARLGLEDPRRALAAAADTLVPDEVTPRQRWDRVEGLVERSRSRRRAGTVASLVAATVAAVGVIAVIPSAPPARTPPRVQQDMIDPPPLLVGHQLDAVVERGGADYGYDRSEVTPPGRLLLRMAVAPESRPQLVQWSSSSGIPGEVVMTLDGIVVRRSRPGAFQSGLLLKPHDGHLVTVRSTRGNATTRLGVALYQQQASG